MWRGISIAFIWGLGFFGLSMLVIRLHMTQLAYEFEDLKNYERSLKEEQLRLRLRIAEALSPNQAHSKEFQEPRPDQVVVIP
jgi:hypothetical protein